MSLYSNSTLSPTGNSLAQEVFPQNPLWCTAALFHVPLPIVALRFGHVKTSLKKRTSDGFFPFRANSRNVFGIIDSLTPVSVVKH